MAVFAIIDKYNKVINRIVAEGLETALDVTKQNCILCDGTSEIGGTWDGTNFHPAPKEALPEVIVSDATPVETPVTPTA